MQQSLQRVFSGGKEGWQVSIIKIRRRLWYVFLENIWKKETNKCG